MVNYSNGKIYKIINENNEIIYIGSTTQTLCKRYSTHQYKLQNHKIILIENYSCNSKEELLKKEQEFIEQHSNLLNKIKSYQSTQDRIEYKKENDKNYRLNNKEKINEVKKKHYEDNKEHFKKYHNEWYMKNKPSQIEKQRKHYQQNRDEINKKITCEKCGATITKKYLKQNQNTEKCKR